MIAQFPMIYPDELLYSLLARYHMRSGNIRYIFTAEDLFQSKTVRPDIEFVNAYTPAAIKMITRNMSMDEVILNHTMFPYYGRFLPKERRNKAFESLIKCKGNYNNLLPIPKQREKNTRYLRYCPICAKSDREKYGETYWHRIHQMQGIDICPVHKCNLIDSDILVSGKASPDLVIAEAVVPMDSAAVLCENTVKYRLAKYIMTVFRADVDLQSDILVGDFLHSKMEGTKYLSVRGEQRNISLFHSDFVDYYKNLPDNHFTELWQIQKVLTNDRVNFYEICLLAMFLNVPAGNLVNMSLPEQTQQQRFDEQVYRLHEQGMKYPEIARRLNAPYDTIKAIGNNKYKIYQKEPKKANKSGTKAYDWQQIDQDTLPLVKDAIRQLQGDGLTRPKKVTVYAVERLLGLPSKRISLYLPKCRAEIEKFYESQEQYWAREVVWAVDKIVRDGDVLNWKHIRNHTNMRKIDLLACLPYVHEYTDVERAKVIAEIVCDSI